MGNKKKRKRKCDLTRDDSLYNEKQKLRYHEKKKQKNTNIEDITNDDVIRNDDVTRDLDQNVDDMNVQNQIQEQENELGMYKYCKFVKNPVTSFW